MTKEYQINANEAVLIFKLGGATLKANFVGGMIGEDDKIMAHFITSNPLYQAMVEKDTRFGKTIFLKGGQQVVEAPIEAPAEAPIVNEPIVRKATKKKSVVKVCDINDAMNYLIKECGLSSSDFKKPEDIIEIAAKQNISFPNLKL